MPIENPSWQTIVDSLGKTNGPVLRTLLEELNLDLNHPLKVQDAQNVLENINNDSIKTVVNFLINCLADA